MVVDRVLVHIADNAGSMTAGAVGAAGSAAVITGQLPAPEDIPSWVWAVSIAVGPACAWFFSRILSACAAYAHTRHVIGERKHARMLEAGRHEDADKALESSDRWQAWSAALAAAKKPGTKVDE
jgi:hypothetical protein